MFRQWMIAGLMSATLLGGIAPTGAIAADQERSNPRWGDRRANDGAFGQREYGGRRAPSENREMERRQAATPRAVPAIENRQQRLDTRREWRADRQDTRQDTRQANRDDRREWRQDQRDDRRGDRRDWNQSRQEDRREWRQDQRDDRRDWRQDRRDDRRDYRDRDRRNNWSNDRYRWDRDWRNDRRYDWQRYRQTHRHIYRGPRYYTPRGWDYGYRRFSIGISLWSGLYSDRYWISDPWYYRLPPAYGSLRWVRYYDDALLVDIRSGYVVDVIHDFFW